jgi:septal ring factor EnvC (AmiA/AmiB activator)
MRPTLAAKLALPLMMALTAAASTRAQPQPPRPDSALAQALDEQRAASRQAERLGRVAERARNTAERLAAERAAAGEALTAAEAGITVAEGRLAVIAASVAAQRARLAREQRPAANLLAGLALMARQPPLLALADHGSAAELVKVRVLIGTTIPAIRARTARIAAELAQRRELERSAASARATLAQSRRDLLARRTQFGRLEQQALEQAAAAGGQSLSAGDTVLAAGEDIARLRSLKAGSAAALALASALADEEPASARPVTGEAGPERAPFAYSLPAQAALTVGLGTVSASGVRSRGVTLATRRGDALIAPAAGKVRFAGPFRDYDGVLILDHGGGWLTLIVNAASSVARGSRVTAGQPLGRALGPIQVELSQSGQPRSPALIAGSSRMSNGGKRS